MKGLEERLAALSPAQRRVLEERLGRQGIAIPRHEPILPRDRGVSAPLSFAQQRLWFLDQLDPGGTAYNVQLALRLDGQLDVAALDHSLNKIVERHEVLRTTFFANDNEPIQVIAESAVIKIELIDLSRTSPFLKEQEAQRLAAAEARRPFDLSSGPVLRASLLHFSSREYVLLLTIHHIAADGWSVEVLLRELALFYEAAITGGPAPLSELPLQYADFAVWQREQLKGDVLGSHLDYWKHQLAGATSTLALPADRPRPAKQSHSGASEPVLLSRRLTDAVITFSRQERVTLFMTLLAAWVALLYRYSGQEDICVGTPIANRSRAELDSLIGFFANTLVLRTNLQDDLTFRELLLRVRDVAVEAFAHEEAPFEQVVEALQPERNLSHSPLFQVMFVLHNTPQEQIRLPGLTVQSLTGGGSTARFDLTFALRETGQGLSGSLEYSTDLFDSHTIRRLLGHFKNLVEDAISHPDRRITALWLMTEIERRQLSRWNATQVDFNASETLQELLDEQLARTPDAIAVTSGADNRTYRELHQRAERLAARLSSLNVGPESIVGICLERSAEMVIALVGVLKAGGAYLPLDPGYPDERLLFMLNDSGAVALVTVESQRERFCNSPVPIIYIDSDEEDASSASRPVKVDPDNAAYVIYTSGSTGRPKGVVVTQRGISNRLLWMQHIYRLSADDHVLQKTPFTFDVSVWEFFWPLMVGARLVMARPGGHQDSAYLVDVIAEEKITTVHFVPSMLRVFLEEEGLERCSSLRRVICSGEALPFELQERFFAKLTVSLNNLYGPTEASVDVTYWECARGSSRALVPIGRPIANTQIHILDKQLQPLPVGVPGELHIGGIGLARGYVNRPSLTAAKFVPGLSAGDPSERLYKTGDLARRLQDGEIEFLGRLDHQVKLRGFRIELPEIESVLSSHPGIKEAVVLLKDDHPGHERLVAFVLAREGGPSCSDDELRNWAKNRLPEYMAPATFVWLAELPLTTSGKVDRRALNALNTPPEPRERFVSPRTEVEKLVAGVWAEVLRVETVGIYDNFFELGGHSLLATQVMSRLRAALRVDMPLRSLFDDPTVAALALKAESGLRSEQSLPLTAAGDRASDNKVFPLSFAQERLWFMHLLAPNNAVYNIATALHLSGPLDRVALEKSFTEIARRHEILRTTFAEVDGRPIQLITAPAVVKVPLIDLHGMSEHAGAVELRRISSEKAREPFDLSSGPLWRVLLFRLQPNEHVVLLAMHHIITDGWSFGVFARELLALYQAFSKNDPSPLSELPIQYADFAVWQRNWLRGEILERQLNYWRDRLAGAPPLLKLPLDHPRPPKPGFNGAKVSFQVNSETTRLLQQLSRRAGVTLFMTVLAVFKTLLHRYTRQDDIVIGADIANRNRAEIEGLIGFFVNMLVLRTDLSGDPTFLELLARVREVALGAYAHQDLPFGILVDELQIPRDTSHNPLFQVVFVLQNAPAEELHVPELAIVAQAVETEAVPFEMVLGAWEGKEGLGGSLSYRTDLFERATAERLVEHLLNLLEAVAQDPAQRLSQLSLLAKEDVSEYSRDLASSLNLSKNELEAVILELQRANAE